MAQPVRKVIKDSHPDIDVKPIYTLLVDGNNMLMRSFSKPRYNSKGEEFSGVLNFLVQLKIMLKKKIYDYIYVFFDDEDSGILRYEKYHGYKANREKKYSSHMSDYARQYEETLKGMQNAIFGKNKKAVDENADAKSEETVIDRNFARERDILLNYFGELYIRWMFDDKTEGDDLIAYYVLNKKPEEKIVIWSTDEDYAQLISDDVIIYNQNDKDFLTHKNFKQKRGYIPENTLIKKIMCGDASDNIKNIRGLSEDRLFELMPEIKERVVSIEEIKERASFLCEERVKQKKKPLQWQENIVNGVCNGDYDGDFYEINDFLVNLKKPLLTDSAKEEMDETMYNVQDPEGRSFENLYKMILDDGIEDLMDSERFSSFFYEFKLYSDNEKKKFKEKVL